jgi:hypothetical protein
MSLVRAICVIGVACCATAVAQSESSIGPPCVSSGTVALSEIVVAPAQGAPFAVRVTGARVEVMPVGAQTERLDVSVEGSLAFRGTVSARDVPFALEHSVRTFGGMLVLGRGVHILAVRPEPSGLSVDVDLGDEGFRVRDVPVPCRSVVLRNRGPRDFFGPRDPNGTMHLLDSRSIVLRSEPDAGARLEIEFDDVNRVSFVSIGRRGPFVHVRRRFGDGSIVTGWARRTAFGHEIPITLGPPPRPDSSSRSRALCGARVETRTIAAGTPVHSQPDGPVWTRLTSTQRYARVRLLVDGSWAELLSVAGIELSDSCDDRPAHAFVPVDSLR